MQLSSLEVEASAALDHVISVLKVQGSDLGHVIRPENTGFIYA